MMTDADPVASGIGPLSLLHAANDPAVNVAGFELMKTLCQLMTKVPHGAPIDASPVYIPPRPPAGTIEMAFSKLKAHLRLIGAKTIDGLYKAVGSICDLYDPDEGRNYFAAARYASD